MRNSSAREKISRASGLSLFGVTYWLRKLLFTSLCVASSAIAQSPSPAPVRITELTGYVSGIPLDCIPAARRVYDALPPPPACTWKRLLSARYSDGRRNHVYCVFSLGSQVYAYDRKLGRRKIYPLDTSAASVARAADFQAANGAYLVRARQVRIVRASSKR